MTKNVDMQDADCGTAPIHVAILKNHKKLFKYLADERRCDIDVQNSLGRTALHVACELGRHELVAELLRFGADTHKRTLALWTPLHFAVAYGHVNVIQSLLTNEYCKPVFIEAVNNQGQTPRDLTQSQYIRDIIETFHRKFLAQRKWNLSLRVAMVLLRLKKKLLARRKARKQRKFSELGTSAISDEARARMVASQPNSPVRGGGPQAAVDEEEEEVGEVEGGEGEGTTR